MALLATQITRARGAFSGSQLAAGLVSFPSRGWCSRPLVNPWTLPLGSPGVALGTCCPKNCPADPTVGKSKTTVVTLGTPSVLSPTDPAHRCWPRGPSSSAGPVAALAPGGPAAGNESEGNQGIKPSPPPPEPCLPEPGSPGNGTPHFPASGAPDGESGLGDPSGTQGVMCHCNHSDEISPGSCFVASRFSDRRIPSFGRVPWTPPWKA